MKDQADRPSPGRRRHVWRATGAILTVLVLVLGSVGVVTTWAVVQDTPTETEHQTRTHDRQVSGIEARIGAGSVSVAGRDASGGTVERNLAWQHERPTVNETWKGDVLHVATECGNGLLPWVHLGCDVDYRATVQRAADADLRTSSAPIEVRGLDGAVDASSSSGDVTLDAVAGAVTAHTSSAAVTGTNLRSAGADVETSSGDVTMRFAQAPEHVEIGVSSGDATVELPPDSGPYRTDVRSSSGDRQVEVATDPDAGRVLDVATSSGDIDLRYTDRTGSASAAPREDGAVEAEAVSAATGNDRTRGRLRRDVRRIHDLGVVGVLAEVRNRYGGIVEHAGVADRNTGMPIPDRAAFRSGSNIKTFIATVVLQLVGEGDLRLDDTVEKWLPGVVRGNGNDGSQITIRHLLQHTSGLYDYVADVLPASAREYRRTRFDDYTPHELVDIAMRHPPEFEPGSSADGRPLWSYTNTGYVLLGMIIEKATGKSWGRQVTERIIEPLDLRDTAIPGHDPTLPSPQLRGYHQFGQGRALTDTTLFNPSAAGASGSMITTTADINHFFRALLAGELLSPRLLDQMQRTVPTGWGGDDEGTRYGLGILWHPLPCTDSGYWAHPGDILGYSTRNAVSDDGDESITIAMSTQLAGEQAERQDKAASTAIRNALC